MDKLEKALEKARAERQQALTQQPAVGDAAGAAAEPNSPSAGTAPASARLSGSMGSRQVRLLEDEMERHRVVAQRKRDADADIFRILRTKVLQLMGRHNFRTLAITSPNYGDGKTTVATNLALSLALDVNQTVLLVDLDLRKPDLHRRLGITSEVGLADYILHGANISDCMVKPSIERVVVLPSTKTIEESSELLGTPKMVKLAQELKERYADRIVIYDMPPLLTQDDTIAFLPNVDCVLLVVRDGKTPTEDLKHCLYLLGDTNVLGTVLNNCRERVVNPA
jgi:capsular exopolysaccharide synthesis family protein